MGALGGASQWSHLNTLGTAMSKKKRYCQLHVSMYLGLTAKKIHILANLVQSAKYIIPANFFPHAWCIHGHVQVHSKCK